MKFARSLALVTLCCVFLLGGCGGGSASGGNDFRVGMECAYPPFNWTQPGDGNGAVKIDSTSYAAGYDIEISKRIAAGLGKNLVIVKTQWDGLLPALTSGKIDAIIAGMSPTAERKQVIDFSDAYYTSDLVVVVLKSGPFANAKTLNDFSGAKITAQLSTFHYTVIDQMPGVSKQPAMDDFPTMLTALVSGKIDGYISERPGAVSAAAADSRVTFVSPDPKFQCSPEDVQVSVGVVKGSGMTPKINQILSGISAQARQDLMDAAIKNQPVNSGS